MAGFCCRRAHTLVGYWYSHYSYPGSFKHSWWVKKRSLKHLNSETITIDALWVKKTMYLFAKKSVTKQFFSPPPHFVGVASRRRSDVGPGVTQHVRPFVETWSQKCHGISYKKATQITVTKHSCFWAHQNRLMVFDHTGAWNPLAICGWDLIHYSWYCQHRRWVVLGFLGYFGWTHWS